MRKSLSILLAVAMVFTMFAGVAFAADPTDKELLYEAGILKGNLAGDTMDDATWTRENVVVLLSRLYGLSEDDIAEIEKDHTFADVTDPYYDGYITWALQEGIFNGHSDVRFGYGDDITAQEFATVILRVLGIDDYENALEIAAELGLIPEGLENDDAVTRDFTYTVLVNVLDTEDEFGVKLGTKLGIKGWEVADITVSSVVATNLKSFTVNFNQAIDKDTVEKIKVTDEEISRHLQNNDKSVLVVFEDAIDQSATFELVIDGVKAADGSTEVSDYKEKFKVNDVTVPVLTDAAVLNHKQIELFFTEPMNFDTEGGVTELKGVKLDDKTVYAIATEYPENNSVIIEFPSLLSDGTHDLDVSDLVDYAGFKIAPFSTTIVVVEDKAAPVATGIEVKAVKSIHVTFNEKLSVIGEFRVNGVDINSGNADFVEKTNGTVVELIPNTALDLGAVVEVNVSYKGQKDIAGNEVKEWTSITTKVVDDTTLPTASISVGKKNEITINFSKRMLTDVGTISLLNKDGKSHKNVEISVKDDIASNKWNSNRDQVKISGELLKLDGPGNTVDPAEFTLVIKDMKDATVRANLLPEQKIKFTAVDTKVPTVTGKYVVKAGANSKTENDTITIYFSEEMDKETLVNLSNYSHGGTAFSANNAVTKAVAASDGKSVTITYENAKLDVTSGLISVYAVKDIAGNMIDSTSTVDIHSATALVLAVTSGDDHIKAVDKNKVEVKFTTQIHRADPSSLKLVKPGTPDVTVRFIASSISSDGFTVTFTTASDLPNDPSDYELRVQNNNNLADVYGVTLDLDRDDIVGANNVLDGVPPTATVSSAVYHQTAMNGFIAGDLLITVEFSEDLDSTSAANTNGFVILVDGKVRTLISTYTASAVNDKAKIEFVWNTTTDLVGKDVKVNYYGENTGNAITDLEGNELKNITDTVVKAIVKSKVN